MKRKLLIIALSLTMVFSLMPGLAAADTDTTQTAGSGQIVILGTTDVHCSVTQSATSMGYSGVAAYKKAMESEYGEANVTLIDSGDATQGGIIGTVSKGAYLEEIMNKTGYDVLAPGNHDFDYNFANMLKNASNSTGTYVCCNLTSTITGKRIFPRYRMIKYGDVKVAYVGITTPETFTTSTPSYFKNSKGKFIYSFAEDSTGAKLYSCVQRAVNAARSNGADYVVAVSHLGTSTSTARWSAVSVIKNTTGIDVIFDGHSHETYCDELTNKDGKSVPRLQAGYGLSAMGKAVIDTKTGTVTASLVKDYTISDPEVASYIDSINATLSDSLKQVVCTSKYDLTIVDPKTGERIVRTGETNLGDLIADANRVVMKADVGICNGGGIRASIKAGNVTLGDVMTVMPYANKICVIRVTGRQLRDMLEYSASRYPAENGGFLQVSGVTFKIDSSVASSVVVDDNSMFVKVAGDRRVSNVRVNGKIIYLNKTYTVAGSNYTLLNSGDGYAMFGAKPVIVTPAKLFDTTVLKKYISGSLGGVVGKGYEDPYGSGRIIIN